MGERSRAQTNYAGMYENNIIATGQASGSGSGLNQMTRAMTQYSSKIPLSPMGM